MSFGTPPYAAHIGGQDEKSLMGVVGTLGTADTGGTAQILPVGVDPLTGALFVEVLGTVTTTGGAAGGGTMVNIVTGTQQTLGTVGVLNNGTLALVTTVSNLTNGSVNILSGTLLNTGTVVNIATGTQQTLGTVGVLNNGTLSLVTTVSNLTNGSVNILTGTVTSVTTVSNLTNGSINILTGTQQQLNNVGTLQAGTVQINRIPIVASATFGSHGTTGASVFGTLAGGTSSGAGTEIFVTSVSFSIPSTAGSQDVSVGFGTNGGTFHAGTGLIVRGNFPAGGGIAKMFDPPINSGTNAQVTVFQAGAGTVDVNITYFTAASTL